MATAGHVVGSNGEYKIVTPDGETYQLDNKIIVESDAYDFALFSFKSDRDYTVATLGNYNLAINERQVVNAIAFSPDNNTLQVEQEILLLLPSALMVNL